MHLSELEFIKKFRENYNRNEIADQLYQAIHYIYTERITERIYITHCTNPDQECVSEIMLLGTETEAFLIIMDESLLNLQELSDYDSEEMKEYRYKLTYKVMRIIQSFIKTFTFYISAMAIINQANTTLAYRTIMDVSDDLQDDQDAVDIINKLRKSLDRIRDDVGKKLISDVSRIIQMNIFSNIRKYTPDENEG